VNEPAHGVGANEPQNPEDEKDDGDSPQHDVFLSEGTSIWGSPDAHGIVYLPMTFSIWPTLF
jgi:hypothetical protein